MRSRLSPYFKISLLLALFASVIGPCQAERPLTEDIIVADSMPPPPPPIVEELVHIRERMPLFPGFPEDVDYRKQKKVADSLMLAFLYGNLQYPYTAWRDSVEGMAVVSFIIEKDGSVTGAKTVRDPGGGTGAEALRLVNLMAERKMLWKPGTQTGKPVRVQFNLPVKFKLTKKTAPAPPSPPPPPLNRGCGELFKIVDEMPRFPGCEEIMDDYKRKNCSDQKLMTFVYDHLEIPSAILQNCYSGMVVVQFVVEKNGSISAVKAIRDPGGAFATSALAAVEAMNKEGIKWIPGKQGGRAVRVQYNVPLRICLQ